MHRPVIQANGRLTFEARRSTQWISVHTGACWQYGHSGGTGGWLGVEKCQFCLQGTSCSAKWHRWASVSHWVSLRVKCCRMVDSVPRWQLLQTDHLAIADWMRPPLDGSIFMARPSTFLESRSCDKFIYSFMVQYHLIIIKHEILSSCLWYARQPSLD